MVKKHGNNEGGAKGKEQIRETKEVAHKPSLVTSPKAGGIVSRGSKQQHVEVSDTPVMNRYDVLNKATTEELFYELGQQQSKEVQGLKSPEGHG